MIIRCWKAPVLTLFCLFVAACGTSEAAIIFEETFSYPAGDLAGNANDGVNWVTNVGGSGNSVTPDGIASQTTASTRASIALSGAVSSQIGVDNSTIYVSFEHQLGTAGTGNDPSQIVEIWRGSQSDNNTVFSFGTDRNGDAPDYGLLIDKNSGGAIGLDVGTADTDTHLVVMRIDYGAGDADNVTIYLDPGASEPAVGDGSAAFTNLAFNRIGFGSFQGGSQNLDNFLIGTTYSDVVAIPEPSAVLLACASIGLMVARRR